MFLIPTTTSWGEALIYLAAALLPAIYLMRKVYGMDRVEKESGSLIGKLIFMGVLSAIASIVLETVGDNILSAVKFHTFTTAAMAEALMVALVEEGTKYFFTHKATWKNREFNFRFDAIVYCATVSLGFAALENVLYVFEYGLSVALMRAILSIPAHLCFAVYMGVFYGRAKMAYAQGNDSACRSNKILAYVVPVLLHGFYDGALMVDMDAAMIVFVIFVVALFISVNQILKNESFSDHAIY